VCLIGNKYVYQKLEVHHITPIVKNWQKRLEDSNLITLCVPCHKKAELGEIGKRDLLKIVAKNSNYQR
jgi:5-methylcytosine-specific restriction endonuclease McrA